MTPNLPNDELLFLPYFFEEEDLYLIGLPQETTATVAKTPETVAKPSVAITQPAETEKPLKETEKPVEKLVAQTIPTVAKQNPAGKNRKKVLVLVGYQGVSGIPPRVKDDFEKIFLALAIDLATVEIVNVLSPAAPDIDSFEFEHLVLMGGNGRNLAFLQNYSGSRNRYEIAEHHHVRILFAESMDTYLSNRDLKVKFWGKLKELFK